MPCDEGALLGTLDSTMNGVYVMGERALRKRRAWLQIEKRNMEPLPKKMTDELGKCDFIKTFEVVEE